MLISEKIFELLQEQDMSQKEFAERTGIAPSSISDWKRKKTNPVSEKILIICSVLGITPEELLSGTDGTGSRSHQADLIIVDKSTELGKFLVEFQRLDRKKQERVMGYCAAMKEE